MSDSDGEFQKAEGKVDVPQQNQPKNKKKKQTGDMYA